MTEPMARASERLTFSSLELEDRSPWSPGLGETSLMAPEVRTVFVPISRSGACEFGGEDLARGATGDPSVFFCRAPTWKRFGRGFRSNVV